MGLAVPGLQWDSWGHDWRCSPSLQAPGCQHPSRCVGGHGGGDDEETAVVARSAAALGSIGGSAGSGSRDFLFRGSRVAEGGRFPPCPDSGWETASPVERITGRGRLSKGEEKGGRE